jgi:hypothetical protein
MDTLYQSVVDCLKKNNKSENDVIWVGTYDGEYVLSWSDFVPMAKKLYELGMYSNARLVQSDLVILGNDWYLERIDIPGLMEQWNFKLFPKIKENRSFALKGRKIFSNSEVLHYEIVERMKD